MKKLKYLAFSLIMCLCLGILCACSENKKQIELVEVKNLNSTYYTDGTIDFSAIELEVTFDDDSKETLKKFEIDIEENSARKDTDFIIFTDGLSSQTAGNYQAGTYEITCKVVGYSETFTIKVVTIVDRAAQAPEAVEQVQVADFTKTTYYLTESVDFANLAVKATYDNTVTDTFSGDEIEFDIDIEDAKPTTKAIVYTNGLYAQKENEVLTKGEYEITAKILGFADTYDLTTVTISDDMSLIYDLFYFGTPEFYQKYLDTVKTVTENQTNETIGENDFKSVSEIYTVGDDNGFDILPDFEVAEKGEMYPIDYELKVNPNLLVKVYIENESTFDLLTDNTYYTYADCKVQFTQAATESGKKFRIEVLPADFTTDSLGDAVVPVRYTVKVADGYNVTDAKELGLISISDETAQSKIDQDLYEFGLMGVFYNKEKDIYYGNDESSDVDGVAVYPMWKNFLLNNGMTESEIKSVNGIFLHRDIEVTSDDIPAEYKITGDETNNEKAIGTIRDFTFLYYRAFTNKDFTFNGNYFKLDFSQLLPGQSIWDGDLGLRVYAANEPNVQQGHSSVFMFEGLGDGTTTAKVTFKNVNGLGNSTDYQTQEDAMIYAGSLNYVKVIRLNADIENCVTKNFLIGWYQEGNSETHTLNINNTKVYDCFNSGIFLIKTPGKTYLKNSELERFGGPAIFLVSSVSDDETIRDASIEIDTTSKVESYVQGTEAWFELNGAKALMPAINDLDLLLNNYYTTMFKSVPNNAGGSKNCLNIVGVGMDNGAITSSEPYIYTDYTLNDVKFSTTDIKNIDLVIQSQTGGARAPIFVTDAGFVGFFDGTAMQQIQFDGEGNFIGNAPLASQITGKYMNIYYPVQGTSTVVSILLEIYPYVPSQA